MTTLKRLAIMIATIGIMGTALLYCYTLPGLRRLPKQKERSLNGITTIDDAVKYLLSTGKGDWELVTAAQKLVNAKMQYSRRNGWDTPARAFRRGMGYCQQQASALLIILHRLGIEARPVQALRNQFPAKQIHEYWDPGGISGHMWLVVTIDGVEKDVCPGHPDNEPGKVHFTRLSARTNYGSFIQLLGHIGSMTLNVQRDQAALRKLQCNDPSRNILHRWGATCAGVWVIKHIVSPMDRCLYRLSNGRLLTLGRPLAPTLLLTTIGRKSGEPHTTPVFYLRDKDLLILCNVNPGFERPNPWTLNLRAHPVVQAQIGAQKGHYRARGAITDEVARYWPELVVLWPAYAQHFARSGRRSIFVLEPADKGSEL